MKNLIIEPIKTGHRVYPMDAPHKCAQGISIADALLEFLSEHCGYYPIVKEVETKEAAEGKAA